MRGPLRLQSAGGVSNGRLFLFIEDVGVVPLNSCRHALLSLLHLFQSLLPMPAMFAVGLLEFFFGLSQMLECSSHVWFLIGIPCRCSVHLLFTLLFGSAFLSWRPPM
jgi:hypothetical protein